jgi:hypothetical protein
MGVIQTEKIYFDGLEFLKKTRCNADGKFRIKYPAAVARLLGDPTEAVADTKRGADSAFQERLYEFEQARSSTRKVILYEVKLNSSIARDGILALSRKDIHFTNGYAISVWAGVFEEERVRRDGGDIYHYERVDCSIPNGMVSGLPNFGLRALNDPKENLVEWTEEREAFFCRVAEVMETLALRLNEMTSEGAEKLAQIADTWSGSLLTDGKD